ncbi:MAG: sugar phosphate isomerase/epimerase [Prolixibacteraceae bacterium]|nr:sugar phosphate isomerase/epimerase [Prolixibacteraceae bacterium]
MKFKQSKRVSLILVLFMFQTGFANFSGGSALSSRTAVKPGNATKVEKNDNSPWLVSSYNFGGLRGLCVKDQISRLREAGYQGIILCNSSASDFAKLPGFLSESEKHDDFSVSAAFVRYNFDDPVEIKEKWRTVVDQMAGKNIQLWVIFGKKVEGYNNDFVEKKLREITAFADSNKVEVVLYPHSSCYFESAEEALPLIEKIDHDNLKVAFHLYHEIRAGNGGRIAEVLSAIESELGAVTIAGTDSVADYSSPLARDTSTIKPLGKGTFDMEAFTNQLLKTGYSGSVGIMNFKLKPAPEVYLSESRKIWDSYFSGQE